MNISLVTQNERIAEIEKEIRELYVELSNTKGEDDKSFIKDEISELRKSLRDAKLGIGFY